MTSASIARREERRGESRSRPASIHDVARLAGVSNRRSPGAERASERARVHQGPRARRDRRTALPPEPRGQDARHPPVADYRGAHRRGRIAPRAAGAVRAVEEAARERGYYASVVHLASDSPSAISAAAEDLLGQEVEGVVIVAPQLTVLSRIAPLLAPIPIVTSLGELRNAGRSPVPSADAGSGARMAMRYLLGQGHRRIVHVAGPPDWHDARSRLEGYESELRSSGLPALPPVFGDGSADSGYATGRALVEYRARAAWPGRGFTAVFAASDQMALGLMHAFLEARLDVPADVSVAGFGDIPEAAHFWPPLTTVRQAPRAGPKPRRRADRRDRAGPGAGCHRHCAGGDPAGRRAAAGDQEIGRAGVRSPRLNAGRRVRGRPGPVGPHWSGRRE